jgi:hypothetical protein
MSTFSTDDWDDRVKQNFRYLRQIVRKGNRVLKSSPSIDGYKLPDDWQWPELLLDKAKRSSEELFIPLTKEKEKNVMSKDIKVGDTAKFVGTVKEIQYNSAGVPSGYIVVDDATGIGSPIPALVTDKVDIHPKLPESIAKLIRDNFTIMGSTNKDFVTVDTKGTSYVEFLATIADDSTINTFEWIKDNESDLYNAYTYGYTVAKDDLYLYPVPNTKNLYFYKTAPDDQITPDSGLNISEGDDGHTELFLFTKDELETLHVSLSDAQVWEG